MLKLASYILKKMGWRVVVNTAPTPRCLICVAPHTSNWDFIVGELSARSVGLSAGFLMKSTWFFFPLGHVLRALGGIAVHRAPKHQQQAHVPTHSQPHAPSRNRVIESVVKEFEHRQNLAIAITPEGTRSLNPHWHQGIVVMAHEAQVPIVLAYIDYHNKVACFDRIFEPTGNFDADMLAIKQYYEQHKQAALYPHLFSTGL